MIEQEDIRTILASFRRIHEANKQLRGEEYPARMRQIRSAVHDGLCEGAMLADAAFDPEVAVRALLDVTLDFVSATVEVIGELTDSEKGAKRG